MEVSDFAAPIPGNSLATHSNGERPWERPPELASVEDALGYYFTNLNAADVIDDLMTVLDMGIAIKPVVETMYLSSVMKGIHNLDVGLLVEPVLTEFLATVAKSYDIDFKFSDTNPQEQKDEKEQQKIQMMLQVAIDRGIEAEGEADKGVQLLQEMSETLNATVEVQDKEDQQVEPPEQEELQLMEAPPDEAEQQVDMEEGAGLMSRRGMQDG